MKKMIFLALAALAFAAPAVAADKVPDEFRAGYEACLDRTGGDVDFCRMGFDQDAWINQKHGKK